MSRTIFRIEGLHAGQWTDEAVSGERHEFATLAAAQAALNSLVGLGWSANELRIVDEERASTVASVAAREFVESCGYNAWEVARDYETAQEFADQVCAAEDIPDELEIEDVEAAARAIYAEMMQTRADAQIRLAEAIAAVADAHGIIQAHDMVELSRRGLIPNDPRLHSTTALADAWRAAGLPANMAELLYG